MKGSGLINVSAMMLELVWLLKILHVEAEVQLGSLQWLVVLCLRLDDLGKLKCSGLHGMQTRMCALVL